MRSPSLYLLHTEITRYVGYVCCVSTQTRNYLPVPYYLNLANNRQRDCIIHSDSHVFNILVEAKPSIEELEDFGPYGTVVLCDWEMAKV
jgi:hypothetical protein